MDFSACTIHVCDLCRNDDVPRFRAAAELMRQLEKRLEHESVHLASVRCIAGCDSPDEVGFTASNKASCLFGGIYPIRNADTLLTFDARYASLEDGWSNEDVRPEGLRGKTLARNPALKD